MLAHNRPVTTTYGHRAADFDSGIRRFDPSRPSHILRSFPRVLALGNLGRIGTNGKENRTRTGTAGGPVWGRLPFVIDSRAGIRTLRELRPLSEHRRVRQLQPPHPADKIAWLLGCELRATCCKCQRTLRGTIKEIADALGISYEVRVYRVTERLVCSVCGSRPSVEVIDRFRRR